MPIDFLPIASSSEGCAYILLGDMAHPLLLDAGVSFVDIQRATGHKVSELEGALITHSHGDHCKAVPMLLERGVDCFASTETWHALNIVNRKARHVGPDQLFKVGSWDVRSFPAVHDAPGTLGYLIAGFGAKLLYLTDSAYSPVRFEGLTHICVECNYSAEIIKGRTADGDLSSDRYKRTLRTHMSLETLLKMLDANDLSKVQEIWLLHLSDGNSNEADFIKAVQRATGKPVRVAAKREAASL